MAENYGEVSVKFTADITPLEAAAKKAEEAIAPLKQNTELGSFTVNWEGGTGSISEYNDALARGNAEWEAFQEQQAMANASILQNAGAFQQAATSTNELVDAEARAKEESDLLNEALTTLSSVMVAQLPKAEAETLANLTPLANGFLTVKTAVSDLPGTISGSLNRVTDSIKNMDRVGRTALVALSTALVAFGKSSIEEYAKYNQDAAASQERLEKAMSKIKATVGALLVPISNAISVVADWISQNQQLVAGAMTIIGVIAGSAGLIAAVTKLAGAIAVLRTTAGGVLGIISLIAGVAAAAAISTQDFSITLDEAAENEEKQAKATEKYADAQKQYGVAMSDVAEEIANIRKEMDETTKSYRQDLKRILVDHEKTVLELTQQIKDANVDYQRAVDERNAAFAVSQAEEAKEHQDKVDEIMAQINFLQRYNNAYNQEKLSQLQFALEKENRLYQQQTEAERAELELQNANEKAKNDAKIAEYQAELDEELALLNKHRVLLESVRGEILDDEVESLEKQYKKQMEGYDKQIASAGEKGAAAAAEWADAYSDYLDKDRKIEQSYGDIGKRSAKKWNDEINNWLKGDQAILSDFWKILDKGFYEGFTRIQGYADGGYTGSGGVDEVAGIVHKGEYVLPQDMVDQTTGTPKLGNTTININVSGTFATSAAERRKVANDIVAALEQTNYARLGA